MDHTELRRTGKFLLFSCSAGLIELGSFALFNEVFHWAHWAAYLTALVLSVLWNFTCNRRYTFRSSEKVVRAMALVFLYYCAFTPLSTLLEHRLASWSTATRWTRTNSRIKTKTLSLRAGAFSYQVSVFGSLSTSGSVKPGKYFSAKATCCT